MLIFSMFFIFLVVAVSFSFAGSSSSVSIDLGNVLNSIIVFLIAYLIKKVLEVDKHIVEIKTKLEGHNYRIKQIEKKIS